MRIIKGLNPVYAVLHRSTSIGDITEEAFTPDIAIHGLVEEDE